MKFHYNLFLKSKKQDRYLFSNDLFKIKFKFIFNIKNFICRIQIKTNIQENKKGETFFYLPQHK